MAFPSPSIFDLSDGAGKSTRELQPSFPSTVQRRPPPSEAKCEAFAFACGLAAVDGALYAGYIDRSSASLDESMLCVVIVGGVGNFKDPLVGAAVLIAIAELLRFAHFPEGVAANMRLILYGLSCS